MTYFHGLVPVYNSAWYVCWKYSWEPLEARSLMVCLRKCTWWPEFESWTRLCFILALTLFGKNTYLFFLQRYKNCRTDWVLQLWLGNPYRRIKTLNSNLLHSVIRLTSSSQWRKCYVNIYLIEYCWWVLSNVYASKIRLWNDSFSK